MSPGDPLERGGCTNGSAVRERGGVREWKGDVGSNIFVWGRLSNCRMSDCRMSGCRMSGCFGNGFPQRLGKR